jgi:hypothetical protein
VGTLCLSPSHHERGEGRCSQTSEAIHIARRNPISSRYHETKRLNRQLCASLCATSRENFFASLRKHALSKAMFAFALYFFRSKTCYFHRCGVGLKSTLFLGQGQYLLSGYGCYTQHINVCLCIDLRLPDDQDTISTLINPITHARNISGRIVEDSAW